MRLSIISHLDSNDLHNLSEASCRFCKLIDLVPFSDSLEWAKYRCQVHGHSYHNSMPSGEPICGQCVVDMIRRIGSSICHQ
ncbi:hypothetical protein ABVK25_010253 [Lepraria finkii]|uniref:F-box domain-containing protein n=1 Tax=Lepraria finkii TaxID=1340010 RepID=A0ABR4AWE3_9LECA